MLGLFPERLGQWDYHSSVKKKIVTQKFVWYIFQRIYWLIKHIFSQALNAAFQSPSYVKGSNPQPTNSTKAPLELLPRDNNRLISGLRFQPIHAL